jgi:galactokinase
MDEREGRRMEELVARLMAEGGYRRGEVRVVRSPLRVCPLGAHIDHQLGKVTGFALDKAVLLAYVPDPCGRVRLRSRDFEGAVEFGLADIGPARPGDWGNYPRGAASVLRAAHGIGVGLDGVVSGPLPIGGLSSSAAVNVAYLLALEAANDLVVDGPANIALAQRIENEYIGLSNGILDQSMILLSRSGALTCLDCQDRAVRHVLGPPGMKFDVIIAYSGVSRALVGTDYNRRVSVCGEAARELLARAALAAPGDPRLRYVPPEVFTAHGGELAPALRRRAAHFFGEMARVETGIAAWGRGDLATIGALMAESGRSSIDNYECGSPHLVTLHTLLNSLPGVYGARFSGAGFGGSALALAHPDARERIVAAFSRAYPQAHPDVRDTYSLHFVGTCDAAGMV